MAIAEKGNYSIFSCKNKHLFNSKVQQVDTLIQSHVKVSRIKSQ